MGLRNGKAPTAHGDPGAKGFVGPLLASSRAVCCHIENDPRGLSAEPLSHSCLGYYEWQDTPSGNYFEDLPDVELPEEMKQLAAHILETKRTDFEPTKFEDRYESALIAMLKSKQVGLPVKTETPAPRATNVVNLMDALRRSIAAEKPGKASSVPDRRKSAEWGRKPAAATRAQDGGKKRAGKRA